jgi:ABC-type phosphate transport system substrate-binding protein
MGPDSITVANDLEMVDKVANDPYAIGYCSTVFADPQRVIILGLKTPDGSVYVYPQANPKKRWQMPYELNWPLSRIMYAKLNGKAAWQAGKPSIGSVMLAPSSPGMCALQEGPLYQMGYFKP